MNFINTLDIVYIGDYNENSILKNSINVSDSYDYNQLNGLNISDRILIFSDFIENSKHIDKTIIKELYEKGNILVFTGNSLDSTKTQKIFDSLNINFKVQDNGKKYYSMAIKYSKNKGIPIIGFVVDTRAKCEQVKETDLIDTLKNDFIDLKNEKLFTSYSRSNSSGFMTPNVAFASSNAPIIASTYYTFTYKPYGKVKLVHEIRQDSQEKDVSADYYAVINRCIVTPGIKVEEWDSTYATNLLEQKIKIQNPNPDGGTTGIIDFDPQVTPKGGTASISISLNDLGYSHEWELNSTEIYDVYENGDYVRWRTDFSPSGNEAVNSYSSETAIGVKNDEDDRISSTSYFTVRFIKGDGTDIYQNSDFLGLTIYPEY